MIDIPSAIRYVEALQHRPTRSERIALLPGGPTFRNTTDLIATWRRLPC